MTAVSTETELRQIGGLHRGDGWQYNVFLQGGRIFSLPRDVFLRSWGHLMGRAQCRAVWPNHIHGRAILVWLKASLPPFNHFTAVAPLTHLGVDRNRPAAAFPYGGSHSWRITAKLTLLVLLYHFISNFTRKKRSYLDSLFCSCIKFDTWSWSRSFVALLSFFFQISLSLCYFLLLLFNKSNY